MKHSKKHEKNNSFLEEVNYYGAINIMKLQIPAHLGSSAIIRKQD